MKCILAMVLFMPLFAFTQDKGIRFERGLTWEQVKAKAKSQNKFIFVDCYATWCGPCKVMDKEIFTIDSVGVYFNAHFVSIKVQMDKTNRDQEDIKTWYSEAENFQKEYNIQAYPTFLFFSPDGEIIHKSIGFHQGAAFLQASRDALDPSQQYFSLIKKFYENQDDRILLKKLAIAAQKNGSDSMAIIFAERYLDKLYSIELYSKDNLEFIRKFKKSPKAKKIASDYKSDYLDKLDHTALFQKENFDFLFSFPQLINSKDGFFYSFYHFPQKTDSLIGRRISEDWIKYTINKEEIKPKLWLNNKPANKPDWKELSYIIATKYGVKYINLVLPDEQISFYRASGDCKNFVKSVNRKIKMLPPKANGSLFGNQFGDSWALNGYAWELFKFCGKKRLLMQGLRWSNESLTLSLQEKTDSSGAIQYLDTKANLLYRIGKKKAAIEIEKKALGLLNSGDGLYEEYKKVIYKMEKDLPTWPNVKR